MKTPTPKGDDTFSKNSRGEVLQKTKIQSTAASSQSAKAVLGSCLCDRMGFTLPACSVLSCGTSNSIFFNLKTFQSK